MTLADVSDVAAIVGAIVALFGFPLLGWQLFLLRPGGSWPASGDYPTDDQLSQVEP